MHADHLFEYIFYKCYFIVCSHFNLYIRTILRLRDAAFEMQVSFHVWGSWIRRLSFVCRKNISLVQRLWISSGLHAKHMRFSDKLCVSTFPSKNIIKWWSHIIACLRRLRIMHNYLSKYLLSSTYCFKLPSWKCILLQPYVGGIKMETYSPTNFPSP